MTQQSKKRTTLEVALTIVYNRDDQGEKADALELLSKLGDIINHTPYQAHFVRRPWVQEKDENSFDIEQFIRDLSWAEDATNYEKSLVAGNLRNLFRTLRCEE